MTLRQFAPSLILTSLLSPLSVSALAAAPDFSAFAVGDRLYVTILADTCNLYSAGMRAADFCSSDRATRDLVYECDATLSIGSTRMACPDRNLEPKVLTLSLKESKVTPEARLLRLERHGHIVTVQLK